MKRYHSASVNLMVMRSPNNSYYSSVVEMGAYFNINPSLRQ